MKTKKSPFGHLLPQLDFFVKMKSKMMLSINDGLNIQISGPLGNQEKN